MRARQRTQVQAPTRGHVDLGLQPERTSLAWARSVVSLFVASAILLRWIPFYGIWILPAVGVLWIAALALQVTQERRYRRGVEGIVAGELRPNVKSICALAGVVTLVGIMSIVFVLLEG